METFDFTQVFHKRATKTCKMRIENALPSSPSIRTGMLVLGVIVKSLLWFAGAYAPAVAALESFAAQSVKSAAEGP